MNIQDLQQIRIIIEAALKSQDKRNEKRFATKGDVHEIVKLELVGSATKEDLNKFATKTDLRSFATKTDVSTIVSSALQRYATKDDIKDLKEEIKSVEGALVDLIMKHHVSKDEFNELKKEVEELKSI